MATAHEHLETFRASIAGCRLALFVDLEAELPLSCSASKKPPQEELDALAAAAVLALPCLKGSPDEALLLTSERVHLFLRSPKERTEALCCVCDAIQDIEQLRTAAQTALIRMGGGK